jgi:hypothetical protein
MWLICKRCRDVCPLSTFLYKDRIFMICEDCYTEVCESWRMIEYLNDLKYNRVVYNPEFEQQRHTTTIIANWYRENKTPRRHTI